ncbi:alpha-amylase family glycosyl hydrolase [Sphingomicrobium aestuariivivum]|uniref:alpha-amylase family glycosyl hydrolase n=1 Tax=Sphingomicrobium aestuariivivum TaxID=1582356 RepID=UPI001FD6E887|nr:alpha-amylase family glycosyl hydrolase [Sphingomicrobium aestuariivivum]MCJ8191604.1 alpha-amylase family glycosyl hydrolase [Sphingomicrobium aestuariivivum]
MRRRFSLLVAAALLPTTACATTEAGTVEPAVSEVAPPYMGRDHVDWSRDAVIYQINTRQFTPEGTLAAATRELDRLDAMGVDILWLMPVQPIGEQNRKGTLGSPYSITDYTAVRGELGDMDDFKGFVDAAHARGMKVILDWVGNHTAWDHPWASRHPDWYEKNWKGEFVSTPYWDWTDIIDLDYSNVAMRRAMTDAMKFWVRETDIDGFRADVAGYMPPDFWEQTRAELEAIKPVWMLGEFGQRDLHDYSFDASYAWDWEKGLRNIAQGKSDATGLYGFYSEHASLWPKGAQRMIFTSNHDENAWAGTAYERLGEALPNAFVLMFTSEGIPLIYNGQEAGLDRRLEFFEKDPIDWREHHNAANLQSLIAFRDAHPALHNAPWGGEMVYVKNSDEAKVFSFVRAKDGDAVFVAQNYSGEAVTVTLDGLPYEGAWQYVGTGWMEGDDSDGPVRVPAANRMMDLGAGSEISIPAWRSAIFIRRY